jgi:hypothetical protein
MANVGDITAYPLEWDAVRSLAAVSLAAAVAESRRRDADRMAGERCSLVTGHPTFCGIGPTLLPADFSHNQQHTIHALSAFPEA